MYKYRVTEYPEKEFSCEIDAKRYAKEMVEKTHNACHIERFNGTIWQRDSIRYFWYFEHICFLNH